MQPKRELQRSRIADRRDLIEVWRRIVRIRSRTKVSNPREVISAIGQIERFGNAFRP
jgi:hypothetical protein